MTKNKIVIRPLQTADLAAVFAIEQTRLLPWTLAMLNDCLEAGYENWVIENNKALMGFGILSIVNAQAELLNIVIEPTQHRCGYAQRLLQHLIEQARAAQVSEIFLEVRAANLPAQKLYEKLNFKKIGERKNYYPTTVGRENAQLFALDLKAAD